MVVGYVHSHEHGAFAGYGRAAAVSAATHPGYTVQEVDNLPYATQIALAPQMGRYFGAYTTSLPKRKPPQPAGPTLAQLQQQAREFAPAEVAAKAAARNLGVRVEPFRAEREPSSAEEYYDLALKSLHAIPRRVQHALQRERVRITYTPRSKHTRIDLLRSTQAGNPATMHEHRAAQQRQLHATLQRPRLGVYTSQQAMAHENEKRRSAHLRLQVLALLAPLLPKIALPNTA
jgi:hypothetical protein